MLKILLFFLFFFSLKSFSQELTNVTMEVNKDNNLVITYDLIDCPSKMIYDIAVSIQKKGDTNLITPKSLTGSFEKVAQGEQKQIIWNPVKQGLEIDGEIKVILSLTNPTEFKIRNGPSNVFLSMLLPGWGGLRVQSTKLPLLLSGGYIYSLYSLYQINSLSESISSSSYDFTNNIEKDRLLSDLDDKRIFYIQLAAGIWVTDFLFTIIKGSVNVAKQKNNLAFKSNKSYDFHLVSSPQNIGFRFVKTL